MSRQLGISASEASTLSEAVDNVRSSTDEYVGAARGMEKLLKNNEDSLRGMGLATRDVSGNLRPLNELMLDGIKIANSYKWWQPIMFICIKLSRDL